MALVSRCGQVAIHLALIFDECSADGNRRKPNERPPRIAASRFSGVSRGRRPVAQAPPGRASHRRSANGARLGWLIDPRECQVHVYRPASPVELLHRPRSVSADPLLAGFSLEMTEIW